MAARISKKCEYCKMKIPFHRNYCFKKNQPAAKSLKCTTCGESKVENHVCIYMKTDNENNKIYSVQKGPKYYKCETCDKIFSDAEQLRVHICDISTKCEHCNKYFPYQTNLEQHIETVHKVLKTPSNYDGENTKNIQAVQVHEMHKCESCDSLFLDQNALEKHLETLHPKIKKCEFCDKAYINLDRHTCDIITTFDVVNSTTTSSSTTDSQSITTTTKFEKTVHEGLKCDFCGNFFISLDRHACSKIAFNEESTNNSLYKKCEYCGKYYANILKTHVCSSSISTVHKGQKDQILCKSCGQHQYLQCVCPAITPHISPNQIRLDQISPAKLALTQISPNPTTASLATIHEVQKNFKCNTCSRIFSEIGQLNVHICSTSNTCPHCKRYFFQKGALKKHTCQITAKNIIEKHYKCDICGVKTEAVNVQLKPHICDISTKCHFCGKFFPSKSDKKNHIQRDHRNKPKKKLIAAEITQKENFYCQFCGESFSKKNQLDHHVYTVHEGKKDYQCDTCRKYFFEKSSLMTHINLVHHKNIIKENQKISAEKREKNASTILAIHEGQKVRDGQIYKVNEGYNCEYCGKDFSDKNILNNHVIKVHCFV